MRCRTAEEDAATRNVPRGSVARGRHQYQPSWRSLPEVVRRYNILPYFSRRDIFRAALTDIRARIATRRYPDIPVTNSHNYDINYRHRWQCQTCERMYMSSPFTRSPFLLLWAALLLSTAQHRTALQIDHGKPPVRMRWASAVPAAAAEGRSAPPDRREPLHRFLQGESLSVPFFFLLILL